MHSTNDLNDGYFGSGKRLRYSINKHGECNHKVEILEFLPDREALKKREADLINEDMLNDPMCMNIAPGGGSWPILKGEANSFYGKKRSQEHKDAMLNGLRIKMQDPNIRQNMIDEWRTTMITKYGRDSSHGFEGKQHSEETKNKIGNINSIKQNGENNSQFGTCWINKDGCSKKIDKTEFEQYTNNGWTKGRIIKSTQKFLENSKSRIFITDGVITKSVYAKDLVSYLNNGWIRTSRNN